MASKDVDVEDKLEWTSGNEESFIHILHNYVKQGELQGSTFKPKTWIIIDEEVYAKTNVRYGVCKLKSKFNRLRKKHREFLDLIHTSGFSWDPNANTVTAAPNMWDAYIKKVPGVKPFRKKGLEHCDILGEIFHGTLTTGQLHHSSNQILPDSDADREKDDEFLNAGVHAEMNEDDDLRDRSQPSYKDNRKRPRRSIGSSSAKAVKYVYKHDNMDLCSEMVSTKVACHKEKSVDSVPNNEPYSVEECSKLFRSRGISPSKFAKLINKDYLLNYEFRKLVLGLPDEMIKAFIDTL